MTRMLDIRKGLKDRVATISGLDAYATMPASPKSPSAAVIPRSRARRTQDGLYTYTFAIWVYVNPNDLNQAQNLIDNYLGADDSKSIEAAIDADPSLGGVAHYAVVTGWAEYGELVNVAGTQLLGARMDVEVVA